MVSIRERIKKRREIKKREKAFEAGAGKDFSRPQAIVPGDKPGTTKVVDVPTAQESFVGPTQPKTTPTVTTIDGGGGGRISPTIRSPEEFQATPEFVGPQAPTEIEDTTAETLKEQIEASRDVSRADLRSLDEFTLSREGELVPELQPQPGQAIVTAGAPQFEKDVRGIRQRTRQAGGIGGVFAGLLFRDLETFEVPVSEQVAFRQQAEGTRPERDITFGELQADIELQRNLEIEKLQEQIQQEELQESQEKINRAQELIQEEVNRGVTSIERAQERLDNLIEEEQQILDQDVQKRFSEESRAIFEKRPDIRPDIRGTELISEAQSAQTVFDIAAGSNPLTGSIVAAARTEQVGPFGDVVSPRFREEGIESLLLIGGGLVGVSGTIPRLGKEFVEAGVQESLLLSRLGRAGVTGTAEDVSVSLVRGAGRTRFGDLATTRTLALSQIEPQTGRVITRGIEISAVAPRDIAGRPFGTIITAQEFGARTGVETLESGLQAAVSDVTGAPLFQQTARFTPRGRVIESFRQFDEVPTREAFVSLIQRGPGGTQSSLGGRLTGVEVEALEGTGFRIPQRGNILFDVEGATVTRPVRIEPEPQPRRFRKDRTTRISVTEETPQEIRIETRRADVEIPDQALTQVKQPIQQPQQISLTNLRPSRQNIVSRSRVSEATTQLFGAGAQIDRQIDLLITGQAQILRQRLRQRQQQRLESEQLRIAASFISPFAVSPRVRPRGLPRGLPIATPGINLRPGRTRSELLGGDQRGVSPTFTGQFLELEEQLSPVTPTQGLFVTGRRGRSRASIL